MILEIMLQIQWKKNVCSRYGMKNTLDNHISKVLVEKCLYLSNRSIYDTGVAIYFLMSHVMFPDQYNWRNLTGYMRYLMGTTIF